MAIFREDLENEEEDLSLRGASTVEAVVNELTKSYGFGRNPDGSWGWSIDRIGQAFKDHPIATSLDYLTLAVPIGKFASSLRAVEAGANVVGRAYRAGAFAGKAARGEGGLITRGLNKLIDPERAYAAEVYRASPSRLEITPQTPILGRLTGGRTIGLTNPITNRIDSRYTELLGIDKYGYESFEGRAVQRALDTDRIREEATWLRTASDVQGLYGKADLSPARLHRIEVLQRGRIAPESTLVRGALGDNRYAMEAYRHDYNFRMSLHYAGFESGAWSKEAFEKGLEGYGPNMSVEWEKMKDIAQQSGINLRDLNLADTAGSRAASRARVAGRTAVGEKARALEAERTGESISELAPPDIRTGGPRTPVEGGAARLIPRKMNDKEFADFSAKELREVEGMDAETIGGQVMNPNASVHVLGQAGQMVARIRYAQQLAGSVVAADGTMLQALASRIVQGNSPRLALMHGITSEKIGGIRQILERAGRVGREASEDTLGRALGWVKMDEIEGLAKLPPALKGRWLDPAVAPDVVASLQMMEKPGQFGKLYNAAVGLFQASKTAYNFPAGHIRNTIGNWIFGSFVHGGFDPAFSDGRKAWTALDENYQWWRSAIGPGAAFDPDVRDNLVKAGLALKDGGKQATAIDWMGSSSFAQMLQKGAGKLESWYRGIDEIANLDAWIKSTRKFEKSGMSIEEARKSATLAVRKFMPNYTVHSDLVNFARRGLPGLGAVTAIPFAGFSGESARVWSNVLKEKPHMAYLWNHFFESASQTFGGMAGYTPEQIEEAKAALPEYQQGKKSLVLPFKVGGEPAIVDMSYVIPLANLEGGGSAEKSFFREAIDVSTNPLLNIGIAAIAGKDSFSGRDIEPRFTERQLGIPVPEGARHLVGLAEHMAAMFLPPWAPVGYAGTNLLEAVRGQNSPSTGEPLEDGVFRTIMSNLASVRLMQPNVEGQVLNVRREQGRANQAQAHAWDRWEFARANGDEEGMAAEQQRIIGARVEAGYSEGAASKYFQESAEKRGPLSNLSKKQLLEIQRRAERIGPLSDPDEGIRKELGARLRTIGRGQ